MPPLQVGLAKPRRGYGVLDPACLVTAGSVIVWGYENARGTLFLRPSLGGGPPLNVEDRKLAARASQGDVEAFTKLVRAHSSLVYRVALRMLGNEDAQDASQEVWVRVWRNIGSFRAESA